MDRFEKIKEDAGRVTEDCMPTDNQLELADDDTKACFEVVRRIKWLIDEVERLRKIEDLANSLILEDSDCRKSLGRLEMALKFNPRPGSEG